MCKKDLPMSDAAYLDQAAVWSKDLTRMKARGPGDTENAMRRVELKLRRVGQHGMHRARTGLKIGVIELRLDGDDLPQRRGEIALSGGEQAQP